MKKHDEKGEERIQLELGKNRLPKISSKYIWKVVFYGLILGALYIWYRQKNEEIAGNIDPNEVTEIENVQIESE